MGRLITALGAIVLAGLSVVRDASADPAPAAAPSTAPAMAAGLDAKSAPLADWIKPGARITFDKWHRVLYFAPNQLAPSKPGEQDQAMFEDPAHLGQWITIHAFRSEENHNIDQYQVAAISNGKIYCAQDAWQPVHFVLPGGELSQSETTPHVGIYPTSNIDPVYISPAFLKAQPKVDVPGKLIKQATVRREGHDVPSLETLVTGGVIRNACVYDLETGLVVSRHLQYQAPGAEWTVAGQSPRGALVTNDLQLLGLRQVTYPWSGKPAPEWTKKIKKLTLLVEHLIEDKTAVDKRPLTESAKLVYHVVERGEDWLLLGQFEAGKEPGTGASPIPNSLRLSGTALWPGSVFLPPAGLVNLKAGQQIDSDPVTKATLRVLSIEQKGNVNVVAFVAEFPGTTIRTFYNAATGVLIYQQKDVLSLPGHLEHYKLTPVATE